MISQALGDGVAFSGHAGDRAREIRRPGDDVTMIFNFFLPSFATRRREAGEIAVWHAAEGGSGEKDRPWSRRWAAVHDGITAFFNFFSPIFVDGGATEPAAEEGKIGFVSSFFFHFRRTGPGVARRGAAPGYRIPAR